MSTLHHVVGTALALGLALSATAQPGRYRAEEIPRFAGGGVRHVAAINNPGKVVGWQNFETIQNGNTFRFINRGLLFSPGSIQPLRSFGTGLDCKALDISDLGVAVGTAVLPGGSETRAAILSPGADPVALPSLGGSFSAAYGVNSAGQIVGASLLANGQTRAFSFTGAGGLVDLGTLGGNLSTAHGVSEGGVVVGVSRNAGGQERAFHVPVGGSMQDLNALLPSGSPWTLRRADAIAGLRVAGDGTVAGPVITASRGYVVSIGAAAGVQELQPIPGWHITDAMAINDAGDVVGTSIQQNGPFQGNWQATLWKGNAAINLNTRVVTPLPSPLEWATGINDRGWIVAAAFGNRWLFLLVPLCDADVNGDGALDDSDVETFQAWFEAVDPRADFDRDGQVDEEDLALFTEAYSSGSGCPS